MIGFPDRPIEVKKEDMLGVEQYIEGLSSFILCCDTPMTIAIQGDWGSGKTSMMNMIKEEIKDKVFCVWFNTWQYSQFQMGDELSISLLTSLVESLKTDIAKTASIKKTLNLVGKMLKGATVMAADFVAGGRIADATEKLIDTGVKEDKNIAKAIGELKDQFQQCVNDTVSQSAKDRIVIFIDDLDRLYPIKAVELLEVIKLYLDCDNCIFILAIDYEVVTQGIKEKFGVDIGEEKGKSFFDKIIQLPFKMPVAQYDITNYIKNMLGKMSISLNEKEIDDYIQLIQYSIGCNPRSMKRLFNAYLLLNKISADVSLENAWGKKALFAILCMQLSFEDVYNYIVSNRETITSGLLYSFSDWEKFNSNPESEMISEAVGIRDEQAFSRLSRFMHTFNVLIDTDGDGELSEKEIANFISVLSYSTITSSTKIEEAPKKRSNIAKFRYNGTIYRTRGGRYSIGYLARDMVGAYAKTSNRMELNIFVQTLRKQWAKNKWLREVIIFEEDLLKLAGEDAGSYFIKNKEGLTEEIVYDGEKIYVAKYWGGGDIEVLKAILGLENEVETISN